MQTEIHQSPTGSKINLHSLLPLGAARAVVHITHGMAEHSKRYSRFALELTAAGFAVFAHDMRGHGRTIVDDAPQGVFAKSDGLNKVLEDQNEIINLIKERLPNRPIICFGHSLGSIINLNFALKYPNQVNALACWNSGIETGLLPKASRIILAIEGLFRNQNLPSLIAWKLSFEAWNSKFKPNRTKSDWLSRDENEVDLYVNDPYCGFEVSISMWRDVLDGVFYAGNKKNIQKLPKALPVHIVGGAEDPCTLNGGDMEKLATKLQNSGLSDVTCTILEGTRHESLNEINRDQTTKQFIKWLEERF
ncbi:alpha/beta hydrolase [Candidatus Thioglobus sp.]|nr:alpha/beta hydrolase [Candidatus Thioglobus sp.]